MAPSLQHRQTTLSAWIPTARTTNFCAADVPSRWDISYAVVSLPLVQKRRQVSVVSEVKVSNGGTTFIDVDGSYPNEAFTGVIFASDAASVGDVNDLRGKKIEIGGSI